MKPIKYWGIKKKNPEAMVTALDVSDFAIEVAQLNAEINDVEIGFTQLDMLLPEKWNLKNSYDVIVSNPPYVRKSEKKLMKKNVLDYEPGIALFVEDENPLIFYKAIAEFGQKHLNIGGKLFCEINQYLSEETMQLYEKQGYANVQVKNDMSGNPRIIYCEK